MALVFAESLYLEFLVIWHPCSVFCNFLATCTMSAAAVAVSCIHYDFTENVLKQSDLKQIVEKVASDYSIVFFFFPPRGNTEEE